MSQRTIRHRILREGLILILGVGVLGIALLYYFVPLWGSTPILLTMTAGSVQGVRHRLADSLSKEMKRRGQPVHIRPTHGSEDALAEIDAGRLDLALVQGGLQSHAYPNVRQVAALHVEPLHLLVKEEFYEAVQLQLSALKGKSVNIGELGSGTRSLALEVLKFAGLTPGMKTGQGDLLTLDRSLTDLQNENDRAKLPDAIFLVSSLPSPLAKHLVTQMNYRLVPLPFGEAFSLESLNHSPGEINAASVDEHIDKDRVYDTLIPAYSYRVEPGVPDRPLHTLGSRLLVVAHKNVSPEAIENLLDTIFTTQFANVTKPALDRKLLELPPEFDLHAGTQRSLQRNRPLIAADVMAFWEKVARIGAPMATGLFVVWQWLRARRLLQREKAFKRYIVQVTQLEQQTLGMEASALPHLRELLHLQENLTKLKQTVLDKFADGELDGKELMTGFLTLVNDVRHHLTRLILHERDHLQEQARVQGRSLKELWLEELNGESG